MKKNKILFYVGLFLVGLILVQRFDSHLEYCLKLNYFTARNAYLTSCIKTVNDLPIKVGDKNAVIREYCNKTTNEYLEWIYGK